MPRSKNTLTVTFKAGDCRYFRTKHPDIGQSWEEQGLREFARAPEQFQPDLHKLASAPRLLGELAEVIRNYDESQLRVLMCVLHDSYKLRAINLKFGQPVYKNLSAPSADYVDCWFRSYVIAIGPVIEGVNYVYITGSLDDIHGTLLLVPVDSVLTRREFRDHRKKLELEGRIKSPAGVRANLIRHSQVRASDDEFPTLSEVADRLVEFETQSDATTRRRTTRPKFNTVTTVKIL